MINVKKVQGEIPVSVTVRNVLVHFNVEGLAQVESDIADILRRIPGYVVEEEQSNKKVPDKEPAKKEEPPAEEEQVADETDEVEDEVEDEEVEEVEEKPATTTRKRPKLGAKR